MEVSRGSLQGHWTRLLGMALDKTPGMAVDKTPGMALDKTPGMALGKTPGMVLDKTQTTRVAVDTIWSLMKPMAIARDLCTGI